MRRAEELKERSDHRIICDMVKEGESVLDLGCANGDLMTLLIQVKKASVQGIELDAEAVHRCVERGLTVFHGDIESGLADYPAGSFDCVVLNQSIQEVKNVGFIMAESLRVGRRVIVGFPNFAHISTRLTLFFRGKTPVTNALPHLWHDTPNVRFFSIRDFEDFCRSEGLRVLKAAFLGDRGTLACCPNLFARKAVYLLTGEEK
ncbi:MAG: methionine biosynthesis protein MetW [Deltaproteobacteria bacterium CG_4_8_14_3_um_filter_51_11]|nr:methionine biosynthesis protein MetW [Deltaproteobacteria bacterium]PIP44708.1 MAG: methionine biosynthesis protein MetW [Deltaproteobacteria bacterium CG23_combo_of_CG06-09_8_20_14_all_51_20]PIX18496.1 MAG: methionine biosynthesis protein MetW [Deltaproteobacteria bacterium CG_4_8_14_3_um_filter_51_11]PIY27044.1 MAG: methionine biosynthesis protein MetW [Deltaproteobacteria bacterium CG_4_10_14_3_um_filter_51_14]PJB38033.1 MAG: methionine biosynthesis protein MetW [Deltaproteobacteria bacte